MEQQEQQVEGQVDSSKDRDLTISNSIPERGWDATSGSGGYMVEARRAAGGQQEQ